MVRITLDNRNSNTNHFHHFWVIEVINNMFQDISVGDEAESTEYDDDGNFLFDVRQNRDDTLSDSRLACSLNPQTHENMCQLHLIGRSGSAKEDAKDRNYYTCRLRMDCMRLQDSPTV